ncbi:MAG: Dabb family protein [Clostridiales bacterium]|nr:Dabb family protein [Clostridiales bacterium]
MIKHIVCFKLKDNSQSECEKTADILKSMVGKVPTAKNIEVGIDFLHSERSYDIILQVTLENESALDEYQNDPYHCNVVKKHMHSVMERSIAVDYQL